MVCQKVTHNSPELCYDCAKRLKGFSGPDAADIDQGLIEVIRMPRKHQRVAAVRRLVTRLYPDQSKGAAALQALKKQTKVLKAQLRRAKI